MILAIRQHDPLCTWEARTRVERSRTSEYGSSYGRRSSMRELPKQVQTLYIRSSTRRCERGVFQVKVRIS